MIYSLSFTLVDHTICSSSKAGDTVRLRFFSLILPFSALISIAFFSICKYMQQLCYYALKFIYGTNV